jgi:adenylate kinase
VLSLAASPARQNEVAYDLVREIETGALGKLIVLLIGQQGTGKSTLGQALSYYRGGQYVSGGVLIRREIAQGSKIGRQIELPIAAGERIAPELMYELLERELDGISATDLVLDGFPGEADEHAEMVAVLGEPDLVLLLNGVPNDELVQRLELRLECPQCYAPSRKGEDDLCRRCKVSLTPRPEDGELEKITRRHARWIRTEAGLIDLYERLGILVRIDARPPREQVQSQALIHVDACMNSRR